MRTYVVYPGGKAAQTLRIARGGAITISRDEGYASIVRCETGATIAIYRDGEDMPMERRCDGVMVEARR